MWTQQFWVWLRVPLLIATVASIGASVHEISDSYLHYRHHYREELRQAELVHGSTLCQGAGERTLLSETKSPGLEMLTKSTFVNCDLAREQSNTLSPHYKALGHVLQDWSFCGEHRCRNAMEAMSAFLITFSTYAVMLTGMVALAMLNYGYHYWSYREAKLSRHYALNTGRDTNHYCLFAPGCSDDLPPIMRGARSRSGQAGLSRRLTPMSPNHSAMLEL